MSYTSENIECAKHKILIFHSQNAKIVTNYMKFRAKAERMAA